MKVFYIAETALHNKSAYSQHVIKMCDAFGQNSANTTLIVPNEKKNINFIKLKKKFLLNSKRNIKINSVMNHKISNFFERIVFSIRTCQFLKNDKYSLIITRSLYTSIFLSLMKIHHFVEIHTEQKSITKFLFKNLNFINSKYIIKVIFISKALTRLYNVNKKKFIVLHDGTDPKNFKQNKKIGKIKSATYIGSFYKGRGIELIIKLADRFKSINFYLYGRNNLEGKIKLSNVKIYNHIDYLKVPKILSKSDLLLMPYSNDVSVNANNLNTANYCSPLKMFDYLAAGKIIISSKLDGILEVLKHKYNSIIVSEYKFENWEKSINDVLKNKFNLNTICKNSIRTAEKYSWKNRANKIINEYKIFKSKK